MLRLIIRRSNDVEYFTKDPALEIDGLREGGPGWWLRGNGDPTNADLVSAVLQTSTRSGVYGYDMVFAAPRSISILLAVSPRSAGRVIAAHRASVAEAVSYLEDRAVVVRQRRGDDELERSASWHSIVSFTHGVNRHGEPHLHDHVLVGARPSGSDGVLDSRALFAHRAAADSLYRASLRAEVTSRTQWRSWRSFEGHEHVAGIDEGYRSLWGGRHSDRGMKLALSRRDAVERWTRDTDRYQPEFLHEPPNREMSRLDEHAFAAAFEGRIDVARRHVVSAWANAATYGTSPSSLGRAIDLLYPSLRAGLGVHETVIGVSAARMISQVRDRGARPLAPDELLSWRHLERVRSPSRSERSR